MWSPWRCIELLAGDLRCECGVCEYGVVERTCTLITRLRTTLRLKLHTMCVCVCVVKICCLFAVQFKRMLSRELTQFAESGKVGTQISEYICHTFLGTLRRTSWNSAINYWQSSSRSYHFAHLCRILCGHFFILKMSTITTSFMFFIYKKTHFTIMCFAIITISLMTACSFLHTFH